MKEQILALLKTKFEGVQDAVLQRIAEAKSKSLSETATEDELQGIVDGLSVQDVIEDYANARVTEAARTSVLNYEKKHGLKNGKPAQSPKQNQQKASQDDLPNEEPKKTQENSTKEPSKQSSDEIPDYVKTLMKQNQELAQKIEGLESAKKQENLTATVLNRLKEKGVPDKWFETHPFSIDSEEQVEEVSGKLFGYFEKEKKNGIIADTPDHSFGSNSGKSIEKEIEEWAEN